MLKQWQTSGHVTCFSCKKRFYAVEGYRKHIEIETARDSSIPIVPIEYCDAMKLRAAEEGDGGDDGEPGIGDAGMSSEMGAEALVSFEKQMKQCGSYY